jgi:hypothetical protein
MMIRLLIVYHSKNLSSYLNGIGIHRVRGSLSTRWRNTASGVNRQVIQPYGLVVGAIDGGSGATADAMNTVPTTVFSLNTVQKSDAHPVQYPASTTLPYML